MWKVNQVSKNDPTKFTPSKITQIVFNHSDLHILLLDYFIFSVSLHVTLKYSKIMNAYLEVIVKICLFQ